VRNAFKRPQQEQDKDFLLLILTTLHLDRLQGQLLCGN